MSAQRRDGANRLFWTASIYFNSGEDGIPIDGNNDMRFFLIFGVAFMATFSYSDAMADIRSMRCGSKLVQVGDFENDVVARCGTPQHVESFEDYPGFWVSKRWEDDQGRIKAPYLLRSPIEKEIWTYRAGPNRLPYHLHFYKGRLTRIETGKRSGRTRGDSPLH